MRGRSPGNTRKSQNPHPLIKQTPKGCATRKLRRSHPPVEQEANIEEVFARMGDVRKRSKKPKNVKVKDLIEEGRR